MGGVRPHPGTSTQPSQLGKEEQGQASSPPGTLELGFRSFLSLMVHIPGWGTALGGTALWMATDATRRGAWWKREVGSVIPFSPRTSHCSAQGTPWEAAPIHSCVTPKKGMEESFHRTFALARQARHGKAACPLDRKSVPGDILSIERGTRDSLP